MKPEDLDITQWQDLMNEFMATLPTDKLDKPFAMRCENTQLTTGWRYGGFTMNGHTYTSFCPKAVFGPCAMLAVRDDFLSWVTKRLKKIDAVTETGGVGAMIYNNGYAIPSECIDETCAPCYWRLPEHKCGRQDGDGPCVHAAEIAERKRKKEE